MRAGTSYKRTSETERRMSGPEGEGSGETEETPTTGGVSELVKMLLEDRRRRDKELAEEQKR